MRIAIGASVALLALVSSLVTAGPWRPEPRVVVLVDGQVRPRYVANETTYVEAIKGKDYQIRMDNPWPVRVAVALSVDGLNTIDSRHTTAGDARKWVIEPHGRITISGWQTSLTEARRFTFTTERNSYGQWLGKTEDLGIISAVFYRERVAPRPIPVTPIEPPVREPGDARKQGHAPGAPDAAASGDAAAARQSAPEDEYAATGMGSRTRHPVNEVFLDLEETPAATVNIRYEFRAQLVRLGILPGDPVVDPLARREKARGFAPGFCPVPDWR